MYRHNVSKRFSHLSGPPEVVSPIVLPVKKVAETKKDPPDLLDKAQSFVRCSVNSDTNPPCLYKQKSRSRRGISTNFKGKYDLNKGKYDLNKGKYDLNILTSRHVSGDKVKPYKNFFVRCSPSESGSEGEFPDWREVMMDILQDFKTEFLSDLKEHLGEFFPPNPPIVEEEHLSDYVPFFNNPDYVTVDCKTTLEDQETLNLQVGLAGHLFDPPTIYPFGEAVVKLDHTPLKHFTLHYENETQKGIFGASLEQDLDLKRWYFNIESCQTDSGSIIEFQDINMPFKASYVGSLYE